MGKNDNGVPIRMVLINIWRPSFDTEDNVLIANAVNVTNPYEFIGVDSDANDRELEATFSFNYFRLGEARDEQPDSSVQRRIVIVDGSNSELLFSLTPVGTGTEVERDIAPEIPSILTAINSVELEPEIPDDLSIEISDLQVDEKTINLQFETAPGLSDFFINASTSLDDSLSIEVSNAVITESETSPGTYNAVIDRTDLPDSLFLQVQF